jgi:hypothetical protein
MEPTSSGGPLWDGEKKFWHCHSDTDTQIFTDTLYGQMLAHHHLQNYTVRGGVPSTLPVLHTHTDALASCCYCC